jgi:hypothetical protein
MSNTNLKFYFDDNLIKWRGSQGIAIHVPKDELFFLPHSINYRCGNLYNVWNNKE